MALTIALAQINSTVGDLSGNAHKIMQVAQKAAAQGADLLVTPELSLVGYPPEDLLLRPSFLRRSQQVLDDLVSQSKQLSDLTFVVGYPRQVNDQVFNAATVFRNGEVLGHYGKLELPNYAVFDEQRYFDPDGAPCVFACKGVRMAINICEDVWFPRAPALARAEGAQVLLVMNASPFHLNKQAERLQVVQSNASRHGLPVAFCNLVGGQDELVFDGDSFALDAKGKVTARANRFSEDLLMLQYDPSTASLIGSLQPEMSAEYQAYHALTLGTRDYVRKNGFTGALVGLSGGVDSALTLAIAADALGPDAVTAVIMPSRYTAQISVDDARACAKALGVQTHEISIEPAYDALLASLAPAFAGRGPDLTEENLQSRVRGVLLMALSNKTGRLVLTTGNKSEIAVGYCTLYGDMAGGYAVIKDLLKGWVYRLSRMRNALRSGVDGSLVIPERILTRAPTAELRDNQTDQDSLPPYDILDDVLMRFVEQGQTVAEIENSGHSREVIAQVMGLIRSSEYKRRQAAPGARITRRAFGRDWRFPLTNRFSEKELFL
nr:Glutamine-dependent NAD(+) synthetase [Cupriavidus sp.]